MNPIRYLRRIYYLIPYAYRLGVLWYKFKCWSWKRYTTIKPRYLGHTWHDRDTVLAHAAFEILSNFVEKECSPGMVDWYHGQPNIEINGKMVYARDEMQYLYDWWHTTYNKAYLEVENILWKELDAYMVNFEDLFVMNQSGNYQYDPKYRDEDHRIMYESLMSAISRLEDMQEEDLQNKLHRLINIRQYMWT